MSKLKILEKLLDMNDDSPFGELIYNALVLYQEQVHYEIQNEEDVAKLLYNISDDEFLDSLIMYLDT